MTKEPLWQRIRPWVDVFDGPLMIIWGLLVLVSTLTMYSAAYDFSGRFEGHLRNIAFGFVAIWMAASLRPQHLARIAVPAYAAGVVLLILVALFGETRKGSTRWLNIGVTSIQPSEILKIGMPLMMAWFFHKREGVLRWKDWLIAAGLLAVPVLLVAKQPDLGTSILVFSSGFFVIYFGGLSWRLLIVPAIIGIILIGTLITYGDEACRPGVDWVVLREYQKHRVCTLLDPMSDPLGKGFHIIQSVIAVGSGGAVGKGWLQGTQTHLEFVPERTTDFIFAAYAEEFGFLGAMVLVILYVLMVIRGLFIAANSSLLFARLLAGAITLSTFVYGFVNLGMVTGILPVVGVPLPWMSYGGTAMVTLGLGLGVLCSVSRNRRLAR